LSNHIHYSSCPSCKSANIAVCLTTTDYTVSKKQFDIWECADCTLRFTQNTPVPDEIGAYYQSDDYISHTNTQKGLKNQLYHSVRKITLRNKKNLIESYTKIKAGNLLDVGAGVGAFAAYMQTAGWKVTGVEPDQQTIERAKATYDIQLYPADNLFIQPEQGFDAITLWHVLEHVHRLHDYIDTFRRLLKPGGYIFIAVPNYTSADAAYYKQYWAAYDVPRHLYHFSPDSMKKLLNMHSLQLHDIKPMWFDSFYISLLSESYKKGGNHYSAALWHGMKSNLGTLLNKERSSSVTYIIRSK
jgi:2-polyprenyl-3-methyl-5-hydroxy-6-metoxy-1,4-benzoquinol methylase